MVASFRKNSGAAKLPKGYVVIPIAEDQKSALLKICVLVRRKPDPVGGRLVVIRDTVDARVLLGCIVDAGGRVHQWLEIWIQNLDGLADAVPACREALSNALLDERWARYFRSLESLDESGVVETGWETVHPPPTYLDLQKLQADHRSDTESGLQWELCQDDTLLAKKSLPRYSSSLHRYLYHPKSRKNPVFIPVTADAPTNASTKPVEEITGDESDLIPLNPGGGLMLVRPHSPIGFETFVDVLSGGSWEGVSHGRSVLHLGTTTEALSGDHTVLAGDGHLFLGAHGRWGRLLETFHLKLRLLSDAVASVRAMVAQRQQPLLNLTADSFQVRLGEPGHGLPFLWTARTTLIDPGDAIALPIQGSDAAYYLRARGRGASVYQPPSAGESVRGRGSVRIRKVLQEGDGPVIVEGTLQTQERVRTARNDLVWLRLSLQDRRHDLYAHLDLKGALASGEWRFRTLGHRLSEEVTTVLQASEGVQIQDATFEVIPLLSSPCDLYALGVLAVRTLLVDKQTTLPVALDETLSLAREVANEYDDAEDLGSRIKAVFNRDLRWGQSLGPQRLTCEEVTPGDAFDLIPAEVWWSTLAMVLRVFPGAGPDSTCQDYGDAQPGGIHKVFDRLMKDLDDLLVRTRSLIVIDWRFNREIHAVIRSHLRSVVCGSSGKDQGGRSQSPG
ncbi:hypothetical protein HQ563_01905 [bacterium]|nr:hypothetical protein [bacterium]